jgi:hypothetical protein
MFRGERLVMSVDVASAFRLLGIRVGHRWQDGTERIDLRAAKRLHATAVSVPVSIETVLVAQDIELLVENITNKRQTFLAALIGTAPP